VWSRDVDAYDPEVDQWKPVAPAHRSRTNHATAVLGGKIYVVGGDESSHLKYHRENANMEVYDPKNDSWTEGLAHPKIYRSEAAMAALDGKLYVAGGRIDQSLFKPWFSGCYKKVEAYDPDADKWTAVASMNTERFDFGLATLKGKVYAVGGNNHDDPGTSPTGSPELNTVEAYDPKTNSWTFVASMAEKRSCHGVAVLNDKLYAVGGFGNWHGGLASVEEYDPETNQWTSMPEMITKRWTPGVAALGGKIYAVGGESTTEASTPLSSVEVFQPRQTVVV